MICDCLVVLGIRDEALSQQLQLDADLTLDKAKTKVLQQEAVGEQQQTLKGTLPDSSLHTIQSKRKRRGKYSPRKPSGPKGVPAHGQGLSGKCTRCGKEAHPRDKCPARDSICHRCGNKGHFKYICFTKRAQQQSRCELCLSSAHGKKLCPLQTDPDPELHQGFKAVETALLSLASHRSSEPRSPTLTRNPSKGSPTNSLTLASAGTPVVILGMLAQGVGVTLSSILYQESPECSS